MTILGFTIEQIMAIFSVLGIGAIINALITALLNKNKVKADTTSTISETAVMVMEKTAIRLKEVLDENKIMADKIGKLEEEIRKLREKLEEYSDSIIIQTIFKLLDVPCFILEANTGKIIDSNSEAELFYGYKHENLIGMNIMSLSAEPIKTLDFLKNRNVRVFNRLHKTSKDIVFYVDAAAGYYIRDGIEYCFAIIKPKHSLEVSDRVHDLLSVMLKEFECVHVSIWDFHNGEYTSEGIPLFRMSTKFEKYSESYQFISNSMKEIPTALFLQSFDDLNKKKYLLINSDDTNSLCNLLKYFKFSTMLASAIKEKNKMIGILTMSYNDKKEFSEQEIDKFVYYANSELLCDAIK